LASPYRMVKEIGRVPSMVVPLDGEQERRFERLIDSLVMVDLHVHTMVLPENVDDLPDYLRGNDYRWGFEGYRHGGWTAVGTANLLKCLAEDAEPSFARFPDLVDEIALMLADLARRNDGAVQIRRAQDILDAKQRGQVGFLPTVEHLAIGHELHRVNVLYGLGIRLAGLTYGRRSFIGDGQNEPKNCGLSEFGIEVVRRMNDLGMVIDLAHAGMATALETIELSKSPVVFSHNAGYLRGRNNAKTGSASWILDVSTRPDEVLRSCATAGGLVCVIGVANALSDDPAQDVRCVLDQFDYMIKLVGADHVAIGTDTVVGDHMGLLMKLIAKGRLPALPAPYLNGLESPADGKNIVRGLIARGHSDETIRKIAGQNALDMFRRVIG
jgi:membrane dipeptidase